MRLDEYVQYDATGLAELVRAGEVAPIELVRLARRAHDRVNPVINAVIEFYDDAESVSGSSTGQFAGVPFLRKDIGPGEAGRLQERGSRLFKGFCPRVDGYYVERARAAGLRILGRTTLPEHGSTGFSDSLVSGVTRNPWDLDRTAGGSSAGSSAAVAAGIVPIAHASDGGGSIRIPASNCGLVGLNPSRGRISSGPDQQDIHGFTRQFVVCRSVRDMATALDVLHGAYPGDPFLMAPPTRAYVQELGCPTRRLRIGVAATPWGEGETEPEIRAAVEQTATRLESMGHLISELPAPYLSSDYRKVLAGMFYMNFTSFDRYALALGRTVDEDTIEPANLEIYRAGKQMSLADAPPLFEGIRKIRADVGEATKDFDLLLTPTLTCTAQPHRFHSATSRIHSADELLDADARLYQYLGVFNVTGQPSVSLPLFQAADGLPLGIQLVATYGDEATLVRVAHVLEQEFPWSTRQPATWAGRPGYEANKVG